MRVLSASSLAMTLGVVVLGATDAAAQVFSSGSTGADGALAPTADVRLAVPPDGVFNFTTVTIPAGVTVSFVIEAGRQQPPIQIRAAGNVLIGGRIDISGSAGGPGGNGTQLFSNGGAAGPGGFDGGTGSNALVGLSGAAGRGPGGGSPGGPASFPGHAGHLTAAPGAGGGPAYGTSDSCRCSAARVAGARPSPCSGSPAVAAAEAVALSSSPRPEVSRSTARSRPSAGRAVARWGADPRAARAAAAPCDWSPPRSPAAVPST
jgi:hypothetical protein